MEWLGDTKGWTGECPLRDSPKWPCMRIRWSMQPKKKKAPPAANPNPPPLPDSVKVPWGEESRYEVPKDWKSVVVRQGRQWYYITNFCMKRGTLVLYDNRLKKTKLRRLPLYHEFSRSKNLVRFEKQPIPTRLDGPLVDWPGWVLTFWCQDLFHTTLTMLPAHSIKRWNNSDIYLKICPKSPCHVKLGSNYSWSDGYNPMFRDKQFGGSPTYPFWSLYQALTDHPARIRPLGPHSVYNNGTICYKEGLVDKRWFILPDRASAIDYANAHIHNLGVKRRRRRCMKEGGYRLTLINRQSATRRLGNIQEVAEAARCHGFDVAIVAFENLGLKEQIQIAANTDCLVGMHGNALIWTKFQERGAFEIEIMGAWYERYAKLFGSGYNHTKMYDKFGQKGNEWEPFHANMTELTWALRNAKAHLDRMSCGKRRLPPLTETHMDVWKEIMERNHPELRPKNRRKDGANQSAEGEDASESGTDEGVTLEGSGSATGSNV